jgi:GT2 family glycosyltransferase/glycosyltransferase involved in cell wall biosynthesis
MIKPHIATDAPLTIVLTSYNYGHYIGEAIASVVNQTSPEWHLIIYDNRSTDNTYEVIDPFLQDPRVSLVIRETNIGARENTMQGLRAVDSNFVSILQADDYLAPTFVEAGLRQLRENTSAPFVFFNWNLLPEERVVYHDTLPFAMHRAGPTRIGPLLTIMNFVPLHMAIFRTTCLKSRLDDLIDSHLTQLGEQFLLKLLEDAYGPGCFSGSVGGVWRIHSAQMTSANIASSAAVIEDTFERHWYAVQAPNRNPATHFLALAAFVMISSRVPYPTAVDWLLTPTGQNLAQSHGLPAGLDLEHFRAMALTVALKYTTYTGNKMLDRSSLAAWLKRMGCADTAEGLRKKLESVRERESDVFLNAEEIDDLVGTFHNRHVQPAFNTQKKDRAFGTQPLFSYEYDAWARESTVLANEDRFLAERWLAARSPQDRPRILVAVDASTDLAALLKTLESLSRQILPPEQIVVVGGGALPRELLATDIKFLESDGADSWNRLGWYSAKQWILGLAAGDTLADDALFCLSRRIGTSGEAPVIYFDHDELDPNGHYANPAYKPAANPDLLRSTPYTGRALLIRSDWLAREGDVPPRDLVAAYRLALRAVEEFGERGLAHEATLIAHLDAREPALWPSDALQHDALGKVLVDHVDRVEPRSRILDGPCPGSFHWLPPLLSEPLVSIIVPTRDQAPLLKRCIQSLVEKTRYQNFEILIVDNDSHTSEALQFFDNIVKLLPGRVRILHHPGQFNFSRMNNLAAETAHGEYLLLLNNDAAALQADWLDHMMRHALRREVGAVGAALYYPNGSIQHAGVIVGMNGPADHSFTQLPPDTPGYQYRAQLQQNFSAVTGACLLVPKALYMELGGLDENRFAVSFNDIDFCLRIRARGKLVLWTPLAILVHDGSASQLNGVEELSETRKTIRFRAEQTEMYARWPDVIANDPAYNPNLSLQGNAFAIETNPLFARDRLTEVRPEPLLAFLTDDAERGRYRLIQPFAALAQEGFISGGILDDVAAPHLLLRSRARAVVFQQPRNLEQLQHLEAVLALDGITAVLDGDDMLWNRPFREIPQDILPAEFCVRMEAAIRRCARIVVSTAPLAQRLASLNADIRILHDQLHPALWGDHPPQRAMRPPRSKPRIGWTDRACSARDIGLLAEIIRSLATEVDWVCIGECPESLKPWLAEHIDDLDAPEYPAILMAQDWDLALAPLDDNAFNACRSDIRVLEYGWCGFPVICSDVPAYRNDLPVIRVANDPRHWADAIRGALQARETTRSRGTHVQQLVAQHRMLNGEALLAWHAAWTQRAPHASPATAENAPPHPPLLNPCPAPVSAPAPGKDSPAAKSPANDTTTTMEQSGAAPGTASYRYWLDRRQLLASDLPLIERLLQGWTRHPGLHLVMRVEKPEFAALAATLQSLNLQFYGNWQVDIVSTHASPGAALDAVPRLNWNQVAAAGEAKQAIDMLVAARGCDWIIELPPGAVLDPMCLLRIANEGRHDRSEPAPAAMYVDDDFLDGESRRHAPRLKPAPDPDWILSTDLLGPVFVSAAAWREAGGASSDAARPWYDLALRVADSQGVNAIGHIAEPLLSLPLALQDNGHTSLCMAAVRRSLARRKLAGKVLRVADDAWRIEYPLITTPMVTIAIPSLDKPEYLDQCVDMILAQTTYPDYEILIVDGASKDPEIPPLLERLIARREAPVRVVTLNGEFDPARFANVAARDARGELLLLMADDIRVTRPDWLSGLVRHIVRDDVACVAPLLASPPDGKLTAAGIIPGLGGLLASPHQDGARFGDPGYLNSLLADRTAAAVSASCMLMRTADFLADGGMDQEHLAAGHAETDLCLRLAQRGRRCVITASVALVQLGASCLSRIADSQHELAQRHVARLQAQETLLERWFPAFASDIFWSRHLDRSSSQARLELRCIPAWHARPWPAPRILGFPVSNAQGLIRLTQPLDALQRAGKAHACIHHPLAESPGIPTVHDLARHRPDAIVAHQLLGEASLMTVRQWRRFLRDTFLVYSVDDLLTDMPQKSSLRQYIPADARSYLARTLPHFDRLVVSTDYLAEVYGRFASDIRIVPNRLERDVWLGLRSDRRTATRPRVGWAGGTAHEGDLQLIADVVAATADEVDWIFMGMCPDNIRPYVREFHPFGDYAAYPARLASLNLDLAVAPLEEIPFNRGKSNLRLLEYGALGIPVICTDIDPYRNSPACRVGNTPRAWLNALRERIHDLAATAREGDAMHAWVIEHYILEDHLDSWLDAHLRP